MSTLSTLSRPYARAAFELAQGEQALASWDDMLKLAGDVTAEESIAVLLDNPQVSNTEVANLISESAGEAFSQRFEGFVSVLAINGRMALLPDIAEMFHQMRLEAENRMSVKVVSAVPLDEDQSGRLQAALSRRFECDIELENEIDTDVIGGAVVYAGGQVIDGSLRGKLQKLSNGLAI